MPLLVVAWAAGQAWGVWACADSVWCGCCGAPAGGPDGAGALAALEEGERVGEEEPEAVEELEVGELAGGEPGETAGPDPAGTGERLSMECSSKRPLSPTTPLTTPASEAGTPSDEVLTTARAWLGACTLSSDVPKAADTADAVPVTGSRLLSGSRSPTSSPSLRSTDVTWATSADDGPYAAANWAGVT